MDDLAARRDKQTAEKFDTLADRNEQQMKGRLDGLARMLHEPPFYPGTERNWWPRMIHFSDIRLKLANF
ncbi:MAG: hypothetical protein HQL96_11980 [Magnetococcales bacterium]|nr:hypothetical protein [Magnetococcales bacterium]